MGSSNPPSYDLTAKKNAGLTGLWKNSERTNNLALAWKFLEDLATEEISVNEVESLAWKGVANREVKKGKEWPRKRWKYDENLKRDPKYIVREMRERANQAKEDWLEMKNDFLKRKKQLLGIARNAQERNQLTREIQRMKKNNEHVYIRERKLHQVKIEELRKKVKGRNQISANTVARGEHQRLRAEWVEARARVDSSSPLKKSVPVFGKVDIDDDEEAIVYKPSMRTSAMEPKDAIYNALTSLETNFFMD